MRRFKAEFENVKVTINTPSSGRVTIDTATADPNEWAGVKEFAFMFEADEVVEDYSKYSYTQLKEKFPDIDAKSKKEFLEKLS
jgi:hypothetical protein